MVLLASPPYVSLPRASVHAPFIIEPICGTNNDGSSLNSDKRRSGEWVGNRELNIDIGLGAVAVPAMNTSSDAGCENRSSITLVDGGVRTEASAVLSSSGCTAILPPDNPATTSAVLVAPQVRYSFLKLEYV